MERIERSSAMARMLASLLLLAVGICILTGRQEAAGDSLPGRGIPAGDVGSAKTEGPQQSTSLAYFAWLTGKWEGRWGPRSAQQAWMEPSAGTMAGILELEENNKTLVIELFSIVQKSGGIELRLRHFTPSLQPWAESDMPLILANADAKSAVFESPGEGEPKRVVFSRMNADAFIFHSEISGPAGEMQSNEITYYRKKTF